MDRNENESRRSLVARRGKRRSGKQLNKKIHSGPVSGTCNVCSAPCSSCMHHSETASVMESNNECASSEESSFANSIAQHPCKGRLLNDDQHTISEISNLHTTGSSHESYSENAESKTSVKIDVVKSEDVCIPLVQCCLVEDEQGDTGKMLEQPGAVDQFPPPCQTEVPQSQMDNPSAVSQPADNIEKKHDINDAIDLATDAADSKTSSCPVAQTQSNVKSGENDTGKEAGNTSGELFSNNSSKQTNSCASPKESEACTDKDNTESEALEDDLKICDICGDVGREDLLALCTRCSDGAEHTYCMRIMLDKLPEGDWLCEECKLKDEAEDKINLKSEDPVDSSSLPLQNLDAKLPAAVSKGSQSSYVTGKRTLVSNATSPESVTRTKEEVEQDGPSPRTTENLKPSLIHQSSLKNNASKIKSGIITPRSQREPVVSMGKTPRHLSPRGALLTPSMNNLNSKAKTVMETLKPKTKMSHGTTVGDSTKERTQTIVRSASFRSQSMSSSNMDLSGKIPSNRMDAQSSLAGKQKGAMEKNSFSSDKCQSNLSVVAPTNTVSPKLDQRIARPEGRGEKVLINKGVEDGHSSAGNNETRKQLPCTPKNAGVLSGSGQPNVKDQKVGPSIPKDDTSLSSASSDKSCTKAAQQGLPQSELGVGHDDKNKEIMYPKVPSLLTGRSSRCQRCNEMGHLTQFCSVDKFRSSALRPSGERTVKDGSKNEKWRHAVEAAILKTRMQRNNSMPIQSNDSNNSPNRENSFKDQHNNLFVPGKNSPVLEGTKPPISSAVQQHAFSKVNDASASRENGLTSSLGSQCKPAIQNILTEQFKQPTSHVSAIPALDYVWQGCFEVRRNQKFPNKCTGVQAHLSTSASTRVVDVATKFPSIIQLEEVSCLFAWPPQFHKKCPTEENIALFFFATDAESYEKSYKRLLENMLSNDIALKGTLDGVELLIFPSNKLPESSQRWNRLFFLWGVFRANKTNNLVPPVCQQDSLCGENLIRQSSVQGLPLPLMITAPNKLVTAASACEQAELEIPTRDKTLKHENDFNGIGESSEKKNSDQSGLLSVKQLRSVNSIIEQKVATPDTDDEKNVVKEVVSTMSRGVDVHGCGIETSTAEVRSSDDRVSHPLHTALASECSKTSPYSDDIAQPKPLSPHGNATEDSAPKGKIEININSEALPDPAQDMKEHLFDKETSSCNLRPNLKRSNMSEPAAQVSTSTRGMFPWKEEDRLLLGNSRESKRVKLGTDGYYSSNRDMNDDHRFSSKVHPVHSGFVDEAREGSVACNEAFPECSTSSEMAFFPVSSGSSLETQPSSFISFPVASPVGDDAPETESPNLDLVLGAKRKSMVGTLPLFGPLPARGSNDAKPPDPVLNLEEDASTSLSLSLAIPFLEERQAPNGSEKSQTQTERKNPDTSLLLFPSFTDSLRPGLPH